MADSVNSGLLSSIRTDILVAFVFSLLSMVIFAIIAVVYLGIAAFSLSLPASAYTTTGNISNPGFFMFSMFGIVSLIMFVMFALSVVIFVHINKMRHAADSGNVAELKRLNSVGWAIIALIFNGLIAGIMLLVANGPIRDLKSNK